MLILYTFGISIVVRYQEIPRETTNKVTPKGKQNYYKKALTPNKHFSYKNGNIYYTGLKGSCEYTHSYSFTKQKVMPTLFPTLPYIPGVLE